MDGQNTNSNKFDLKQWKRYVTSMVLLKQIHFDDLSEWEQEFFKSCYQKLGKLSPKQIKYLDKIILRYFDKI